MKEFFKKIRWSYFQDIIDQLNYYPAYAKTAILILVFPVFSIKAIALDPPVFDLVLEIDVKTHDFSIDKFSNIYWIQNGGLVKRKLETGNELFYSNKNWGEIHSIDVSDPFNIIVYFKDFEQIVFLDKNLSPKRTSLNNDIIKSIRPSIICASDQNGLWAFSPQSYKIYRLTDKLNVDLKSETINHLFPEFSSPFYMTEDSGKLFVSEINSGIWVFDRFVNFLFIIPMKNTTFFQVRDNTILYFYDDQIGLYDFENHTEELILLPEKNVEKGYIHDMSLFLLTENKIKQYKIK